MGNRLQITLAAEFDSLAVIREFVDRACREADVDDEACYDIKLAADEACTNIIEHGYAGLEPGSIIFSLQYGAQQVVVRLTDFGHPFEPAEPPTPDAEAVLESGELGGFGLYFMHRSMDSVTYEPAIGGNTLTMIKKLKNSQLRGG
jgi:serine/threonine-protein kinase RsbW